jgi:hypothetical protein
MRTPASIYRHTSSGEDDRCPRTTASTCHTGDFNQLARCRLLYGLVIEECPFAERCTYLPCGRLQSTRPLLAPLLLGYRGLFICSTMYGDSYQWVRASLWYSPAEIVCVRWIHLRFTTCLKGISSLFSVFASRQSLRESPLICEPHPVGALRPYNIAMGRTRPHSRHGSNDSAGDYWSRDAASEAIYKERSSPWSKARQLSPPHPGFGNLGAKKKH